MKPLGPANKNGWGAGAASSPAVNLVILHASNSHCTEDLGECGSQAMVTPPRLRQMASTC